MESHSFKYFLKAGLGLGVGLSAGLALTILSTLLLADVLHRFEPGDLISADQINENFEDLDNQIAALRAKPPIGTIVAWHKSMSGVPALPDGWVECDGETINDTSSPLNGQTLPNLNGERRFLRGGSTSGNPEGDALQGHNHAGTVTGNFPVGYNFPDGNGLITPFSAWSFASSNLPLSITNPTDSGYGTPRIAGETRPINMSVVWIMRVK